MLSSAEQSSDGAAKAKIVTMAEAVSLVELAAKGQVLKAERKDKPQPYFKFDVQTMQGGKEKWEVDIQGQVRKVAERTDDR